MIKKQYLNSITFLQIYSFLTTAIYGCFFFIHYLNRNLSPFYLPLCFIIVWQALFILFSLFPRNIIKTLCMFLLIGNAIALYFMYAYHIPVDKIMIMNALQTDQAETSEIININLIATIILLGVLPVIWIGLKTVIHPCSFQRTLKSIILSLSIILTCCILAPSQTNKLMHHFKYLQIYLPPINYLLSGGQIIIEKLTPQPPLQRLTDDIKKTTLSDKPNLIVFIVGETTRAANFSLNGYHRPTNQALTPYLKDIIYYPDTGACGTSTAISVPCIFSVYNQKQFQSGSEQYTENVLDIFKKAGYKVRWFDNDGGCKNVCNRVLYEEPCKNKTCSDNILLNNLKNTIQKSKKNQLIILHTRGSHGPSYHLRYEKEDDLYAPICTIDDIWNCTPEELVNVYDNTIHYVSRFIAKTIDILKSLEKEYNTSLIYTSDHGESLKEDGLFLHSAPMETAPKYQTEVPLLVWLPQNNLYHLNKQCLKNKASKNKYSHDNIFHSLLGLGNIKSSHYQRELDIFAGCKR